MGAHRLADARRTFELREAAERVRHSLEWQRVRHDSAAVDRRKDRCGLDLGSGGDLGEHHLLAGVARAAIPSGWPATCAAKRQEAGMLAGARVSERRRLRPALELVLPGRRVTEQTPHGVELLGARNVGGAGDCELDRKSVV